MTEGFASCGTGPAATRDGRALAGRCRDDRAAHRVHGRDPHLDLVTLRTGA